MTNRHGFGQSLNIRLQAEEVYRKSQASSQLSRLLNMRTRPLRKFLPGDLVYYRREKVPADRPAHPTLGIPKAGMGRWYGPGRVLATETRTDAETRRPGHVVWIVSAGRLKRCSPDQLRHASEREAALAESASDEVTPGWTFHSLVQGLQAGNYDLYDDYVFPEDRSKIVSRRFVSRAPRSRTPAREPKEQNQEPGQPTKDDQEPEGPRAATAGIPKEEPSKSRAATAGIPEEEPSKSRAATAGTRMDNRSTGSTGNPGHFTLGRYLQDPGYEPDLFRRAMERRALSSSPGELEKQQRFKQARLKHEHCDRPWHVVQSEHREATSAPDDESAQGFVDDLQEDDILMCKIEVNIPDKANEWRQMKRDPTSWMIKGLRKTEVDYKKLSQEERAGFDKAKEAEVDQWVREAAARKAAGWIPEHRIMRMRWVLTWKAETNAPKARLVVVGFEDPDLETIVSSSPTMSRRTRQLFYLLTKIKGWKSLKGDVKAAFLQGNESQVARGIYARAPPELAARLGVPPWAAIQLQKAAYGLVNAPAEWYRTVNAELIKIGFERMRTEPCGWRLTTTTATGERILLGIIIAHVDDFLVCGDENNEQWMEALSQFYARFRWSPWETNEYMHCGVRVKEGEDEVILEQSEYCANIEEVKYEKRDEKLPATPEEVTQLRGVLGAIQWRAYSTAPQHMATLSMLQSQTSKATVGTLQQANKLAREVYAQRHMCIKIPDLQIDPDDVTFVAWSDAAVGNRPDLGSTGGYIIAATTPNVTDGDVCKMVPVSWRSGKLPRVARSSLSAETRACSEAEEELMYLRVQWREMCGHEIDLKRPAQAAQQVKGIVVTDARSLYDLLHKKDLNSAAGGLKEKYTALEALSLLERLQMTDTEVRWVHSDAQVADALTKPNPSGSLYAFLTLCKWRLIYDPTFTSAKKIRQQKRFHQ